MLSFFFPKSPPLKNRKGDGPLPAAKFYGHAEPAAASRSIKEAAKESAKPTLKQAFSSSTPENPQKSIPMASKKREEVHSALQM